MATLDKNERSVTLDKTLGGTLLWMINVQSRSIWMNFLNNVKEIMSNRDVRRVQKRERDRDITA